MEVYLCMKERQKRKIDRKKEKGRERESEREVSAIPKYNSIFSFV